MVLQVGLQQQIVQLREQIRDAQVGIVDSADIIDRGRGYDNTDELSCV